MAGNEKPTVGKKRDRNEAADEERDLLEDKKSAEEALHSSMYALVKEKGVEPWQMVCFKVLAEGIVPVLVLFNPQRLFWDINEQQWTWKLVRWFTFRSPIVTLYSYNVYAFILYILVSVIFAVLAGIAFLAWSMRKSEQAKWLKVLAKALQLMSDILFSVLYMSILDYMMFFFNCEWSAKPIMHLYYTDLQCLASPHMMNLGLAGLTAVIFTISTVAVQTAGCDLNPCAKGLLASPAATMKIKVVFAKALFVSSVNMLSFSPKLQAVVTATSATMVFWLNFNTVPFLRDAINYVWCGMWLSVLYVSVIYLALALSPDGDDPAFQERMTKLVLYGIWAPLLAGAAATAAWHRARTRAVKKFVAVDAERVQLRRVHKFSSPAEVELLCRAAYQFDLDGVMSPDSADLGETIMKAGLSHFPNHPMLLILRANFMMEVHQDGPGSRTQLQTVSKHMPNFVERYQVFCTVMNSKRLKDSTDHGMDMNSYVEFKRNYMAALRSHKDALTQVRDFWHLLLKPDLKADDVEAGIAECDAMIQRSYRVYRRVVERYPKNGRLLKCYGNFLEHVRNDFKGATRVYAEAVRNGSSGNGILSMDFDFASQPGKPDMLLGIDKNEDAIVIINAEGTIMLVSQGITPMFGYTKTELERQNISLLMPPPFRQRHPSYLQHYKDTGEARILDTVKEVVALNKERHVFPVQICVTKLSGAGADAVFLGLLRPLAFSKRDVRAWLAPSGVIMCCGPMFSAMTGIPVDEMVGMNLKSMMQDPDPFDRMLAEALRTPVPEFTADRFKLNIVLPNKYTGSIPCHVHLTMGGTDTTRVIVMHISREDERDENLLVLDEQGNVTFATIDLAVSLGYTLKGFLKLNLAQLIPAPVNMTHKKFLLDAPPTHPATSCRSGAVVNMLTCTNQLAPVRIKLSQRDEPSGLKHVVQVFKSSSAEFMDSVRLSIITSYGGIIQSVSPPTAVFGFPSESLTGLHLSDVIDVFKDWESRSESRDMQLFLLALLDKEQEMPGSAWRIKITPPANLTATSEADMKPPKSAILVASLAEVSKTRSTGQDPVEGGAEAGAEAGDAGLDDRPWVQLTLWRRELLSGSLQLDQQLRVRRCNQLAGLILGRPASSLLKKAMYKFLHVPRNAKWEEVMSRGKRQRTRSLSIVKALTGSHPDGGNLRILVQGLEVTDANGKKVYELCIKPDMTFTAAHSNIWGALGLEFEGQQQKARGEGSGSERSGSGAGAAAGAALDRAHVKKQVSVMVAAEGGQGDGGDFVNQWVRTMDKTEQSGPGGRAVDPGGGGVAEEAPPHDWVAEAEDIPDEAFSMPQPQAHAVAAGGRPEREQDEGSSHSGSQAGSEGESDAASSTNNDEDAEQRSTFSSVAGGEEEILVDSRRGKVLHKLLMLLQRPAMTSPIQRVMIHTVAILVAMLLVRVIFFFVSSALVLQQTQHIRQVQDTAIACDRTQVIATSSLILALCLGQNASMLAADNVCHSVSDVAAAVRALSANVADLDAASRSVFLGLDGKVMRMGDSSTYWAWNDPLLEMSLYMDTSPAPTVAIERRSLWEVSNRVSAAAKEMMWLSQHRSAAEILASPAYNFILLNAPTCVFDGYAHALDTLMVYSWNQLASLKVNLIILMVIEALLFIPAMMLWQWFLIHQAERTRHLSWMMMIGLPRPVLLTLGTKPIIITDDSEDDSDGDSDAGARQHDGAGAGGLPHDISMASSSEFAGFIAEAERPEIAPSRKHIQRFLVPLALVFVAVLSIYVVILVQLQGVSGPLVALNMAMRVLLRFSHLCFAAFSAAAQSSDAGRAAARQRVAATLADLTSEYNTLTYGGLAATQDGDLFTRDTPAAPFLLAGFSALLFKATSCMRADESTCSEPGSPWYEATHHGVDYMMQRMLAEMRLIVEDTDSNLVYYSERYNATYHVGMYDMYNGLQASAQLFVDMGTKSLAQINTLQAISLAALAVLELVLLLFVLRPYLALRRAELLEVAGMISHVPQEVDIMGHVRRVMRRGTRRGGKHGAGSGSASGSKDPGASGEKSDTR